MSQIIATFFYIGYMRPAPGTWGSLAAIPFAWIIIQLTGFSGLALATLIVFALGLWATKAETAGREITTHPRSSSTKSQANGSHFSLSHMAQA